MFTPDEDAEGKIEIDNSQCKIAVTKVQFAILQVVSQKIKHHNQRTTKTIIERSVKGPDAGKGDWEEVLKLELDKIKYEVATMKKKKGKEKKVSKEDKFMMASLQPACHTPKFSNEYVLSVNLEYDGCICCVDLPDAKMPMTIVPIINPKCFGFKPDDDWSPSELGAFTVDVAHDPDSD